MAELKITESEILFLEKNIKRKIIKENSNEIKNTKSIIWNSNPANYTITAKCINKKLKKPNNVANSFLRDFFYNKEDSKTVRDSSINKFYLYLFNMTREEYFKENPQTFNDKKNLLYYISIDDFDLNEIQTKTNLIFQKINIIETKMDVFLAEAKKKNNIYIYIDQIFLHSIEGMQVIFELFRYKLFSFIVDFKITFILSNDLLQKNNPGTGIDGYLGKIKLLNYWKDLLDGNEVLFDKELVKFLTTKKLLILIKNILSYNDKESVQSRASIDAFLPVLQEMNDIEIQHLPRIYKEFDNKGKGANIIGVIAYKEYFMRKEKMEMLKYFHFYGKALSKARLLRIFTIPAKRVQNKGWKTTLNIDESKILYQYILMNLKHNVKTYLLMFDENKENEQNEVLWKQDYVLGIPYSDDNSQILSSVKNGFYKMERESISKNCKLFFAFPERKSGVNNMLKVDSEFYINRMFKDLMNRISLIDKDSDIGYIIEVKDSEKQFLRKRINLLHLNEKKLNLLEEEIEQFF